MGLIRQYGTDKKFANACLKLFALSFLPDEDIIDYFNELEPQLPEQLSPVTDWFIKILRFWNKRNQSTISSGVVVRKLPVKFEFCHYSKRCRGVAQ
jgi:hypothetical protein